MERDAGKDIRLYRLQKWISDEYDRVNRKEKNLLAKEQGMFLLSDYAGIFLEFFRDAICYGYLLLQLTQGMDLGGEVLMWILPPCVRDAYGQWDSCGRD